MPASRPRIDSGMVWLHTVLRKIPEIMSAAPANASSTTTSQNDGIRPASATNAPYDAAATTIARPWWWKRVVQPDRVVATTAPMVSAE